MNIKSLKRKLRKIILGFDTPTYYFSQAGEDAILQALFHKKLNKKEKGFYVDVGAYHPYKHSNTYLFYLNGWNGINVDACPGSMDLFKKLRPKDLNLEIGISDKKGELTYYFIDKDSTMNSFSKENLINIGMYKNVTKEIPIGVKSLEDILESQSNNFNHIDFLSIDVEGLDFEVINSNNWIKYKPDVIVIELNCIEINDIIENKTARFLRNLGYRIVAKNVVLKNVASVFFVKEEFEY